MPLWGHGDRWLGPLSRKAAWEACLADSLQQLHLESATALMPGPSFLWVDFLLIFLISVVDASTFSPISAERLSVGRSGKAPPAAVLKEKVYVSTTYTNSAQNIGVSSINAGMSASLCHTPPPKMCIV